MNERILHILIFFIVVAYMILAVAFGFTLVILQRELSCSTKSIVCFYQGFDLSLYTNFTDKQTITFHDSPFYNFIII